MNIVSALLLHHLLTTNDVDALSGFLDALAVQVVDSVALGSSLEVSNTSSLIVEDDGAGMEDLSVWESGYGVQNVQQRIHLHYGNDYGARVESERNKGTRVTVTLPLQTGV